MNSIKTVESISKRLIELNNIKFDKDGDWTPILRHEHERLTHERNRLMGSKIKHFVLR